MFDWFLIDSWFILNWFLIDSWLISNWFWIDFWLVSDWCLSDSWLILDWFLIVFFSIDFWLIFDGCLIAFWLIWLMFDSLLIEFYLMFDWFWMILISWENHRMGSSGGGYARQRNWIYLFYIVHACRYMPFLCSLEGHSMMNFCLLLITKVLRYKTTTCKTTLRFQ